MNKIAIWTTCDATPFFFYVEVKNGESMRKGEDKSKKNLKVEFLLRNILYIRELFVILHSVWNRYQLTN